MARGKQIARMLVEKPTVLAIYYAATFMKVQKMDPVTNRSLLGNDDKGLQFMEFTIDPSPRPSTFCNDICRQLRYIDISIDMHSIESVDFREAGNKVQCMAADNCLSKDTRSCNIFATPREISLVDLYRCSWISFIHELTRERF